MSNELTTNLNDAQLQIFTQTTPKEAIRTRQGRGGRILLYTDGAYVIRTLNEAFNFQWDFEADHEEIIWLGERPFEARCRGKLIVRTGETTITKMQFGSQPIEMLKDGSAPVSLGDAYKGAATDALKKCASLLGIALDLYDSDSEINTANPQQVQKEIAQAKQQAKVPVTPTVIGQAIEQPKPTNGQAHVASQTVNTSTGEVMPSASFDSPITVIEAVHAAISAKYYADKAGKVNMPHAFNTLKKETGKGWPDQKDKAGWQRTYEILVNHARNEIALKEVS